MDYTLITGACGVLGGAFVRELARRGEPLFLTGRSEEKLSALVESVRRDYSVDVLSFPCDLAREDDRKRLFSYFDENEITFSRLIYVAGADIQKAFERYSEEKIILQTRANFEGAVSLIRAVLDRASLNGKTEILTIGSVSGLYPMPYFALYSATKKALAQFCRALRVEMKGKAKVTCVQCGAIPTRADVVENIKTQGMWGRMAALPPEKVVKKSLKAVKRNRAAPVLGFWNKCMHAFTAPLPLSLKMRFIARRWKKTEKDAF